LYRRASHGPWLAPEARSVWWIAAKAVLGCIERFPIASRSRSLPIDWTGCSRRMSTGLCQEAPAGRDLPPVRRGRSGCCGKWWGWQPGIFFGAAGRSLKRCACSVGNNGSSHGVSTLTSRWLDRNRVPASFYADCRGDAGDFWMTALSEVTASGPLEAVSRVRCRSRFEACLSPVRVRVCGLAGRHGEDQTARPCAGEGQIELGHFDRRAQSCFLIFRRFQSAQVLL